MEPKFKRRRLLVDPSFQLRLLWRAIWYAIIWTIAAFHLSLLAYLQEAYIRGDAQHGFGRVYLDFLSSQKSLIAAVIVITPMIIYDLLKFSNRLAGPLFRCRRVMREMAAGKTVPEFKEREGDLLKDVFADFNALIRAWNLQLAAAQAVRHEENGAAQPAEENGELANHVCAGDTASL
jgi:hypothetical protein